MLAMFLGMSVQLALKSSAYCHGHQSVSCIELPNRTHMLEVS